MHDAGREADYPGWASFTLISECQSLKLNPILNKTGVSKVNFEISSLDQNKMKTLSLLTLLFSSILLFSGCNDDDDAAKTYEYHAHIQQPSTSDKNLGDILPIAVEFESHTGEAVEHINVRIYNKDTNIVVYSAPADAHVGNGSASYEFEDQVALTLINGFLVGHWVLEAKVWGEEHEQDQVTESIEFHIK